MILEVFSVVVTAVPDQPAAPQTLRRAIGQLRPAAVAAVAAATAVASAAIAADSPMKLLVGVHCARTAHRELQRRRS